MVMDRTSITRALVPLERDGFISSHQGADKRTRLVALTKKGHQVVKDAEPRWQKAQQTLMEAIGNQPWAAMRDLLRDTTRLVRQ